jgi:hypothetical protein
LNLLLWPNGDNPEIIEPPFGFIGAVADDQGIASGKEQDHSEERQKRLFHFDRKAVHNAFVFQTQKYN